ncbi:transglutaminase family protein [Phenylobacterium sp.]|uniref:transglutaminase family protein n=1 Tax=Phenylobacterium sp. TaxID=1871053 RepID=UPI0030F3B20E
MRLKITHLTEYVYDAPVAYALQQLRLTPKVSAGQSILSWSTQVEGASREAAFTDQHNNHVELLCYEPQRQTVSILSQGEVETATTHGVIGQHGGYAPLWYFQRPTRQTKAGPLIRGLVKALGKGFDNDPARLHGLSAAILQAVTYETGKTDFTTSAEQALEAGHGVCQDHAHIFVSAARLLGYPARYVGGYLLMDDRIEQQAGHAWAEAHIEGLGWVGFDVSNGVSPDERYVRVSTGLDYGEAAPISGMIFGQTHETMSVSLRVEAA